MYLSNEEAQFQRQQLSPYSMNYFQNLKSDVNQINHEVKHITHFQQQRQKKFQKSMKQYKKYLQNQRKGLQKNSQHCKVRNQWYKEQLKKSWQISISNRQLVLRSLARTNNLKRDCDQWLAKIDDNVLAGQLSQLSQKSRYNQNEYEDQNNMEQSQGGEANLRGSKLIDKYNQILSEYYHKI